MTPERFRTLLQAYGADLRRWPDGERAAARSLLAEGTPELTQLQAEAALLDRWLDSQTVAAPDSALLERIVAGADADRPATAKDKQGWRRTWWWPGAGLAGIGLAGSVVGAFAVSVALRNIAPASVDWPERGTAFSGPPAEWSEE